MAAQQDQVFDRRAAAVRPVTNMMRIDEAVVVTARKTAAAVARLQDAAQGRRHGARPAADIERIARIFFSNLYQTTVTSNATHHIRGQSRAVFNCTAFGLVSE